MFYKKSRLPSLLKLNCQQQFQPATEDKQPATLFSFSPKTSSHGSHEEDHEGSPFLPPQDCKGGHEEDKKGKKKHGQSHRWGPSPNTRRSREFAAQFTGPPSRYIPLPGRLAPLPGRFATPGRYDPLSRRLVLLPRRFKPQLIGQ